MLLNQIVTQLNLQPALVDHSRLTAMLPAMVDNVPGARAHPEMNGEKLNPEQYALATGFTMSGSKYKPYRMAGNIAVIPVQGVLLHKYGWSGSWATGYDVLQRKLAAARQDPDVHGIFLDFQTYGGTVAGCADTADLIAEIGKEKPIAGHSHDAALSAGLWLYSQCTTRYITQTASSGSLGCVVMHVNQKGMLDNIGIAITMIHAGSHKVDGHPYDKLSAEVEARLQASVEANRQAFAAAVARGVGISVQAALDTEALCYTGQQAVDVGLAQQVVRGDKGVELFQQHVKSQRNPFMNQANLGAQTPAAPAATAPVEPGAVASAPVAQPPAEGAPPLSAAATERQRIGAIVNSAEAHGRGKQANHLAFNTDLSAEACIGILAASGQEQAAPPAELTPAERDKQYLAQIMGSDTTPEIGADNESPSGQQASPPKNQAADILATSLAHLGIPQE